MKGREKSWECTSAVEVKDAETLNYDIWKYKENNSSSLNDGTVAGNEEMGVMPVDGIMRENESGIFSTDDQSKWKHGKSR